MSEQLEEQVRLILASLNGELSEEDNRRLNNWLEESTTNRLLYQRFTQQEYIKRELQEIKNVDSAKGWKTYKKKIITDNEAIRKKNITLIKYVVAASMLTLVILSVYWWQQRRNIDARIVAAIKNNKKEDIQPGTDKAVLTLADGTKIVLDSVSDGTLAEQGSTKIINLGGRLLSYKTSSSAVAMGDEDLLYNTIATPRGGQYQLILPDGTKVWLNAGSSLRFPVAFHGTERKVELKGEGYFDVAANKQMSFKVLINRETIQALGTEFNVMGYDNEEGIKTTLINGAVKVTTPSAEVILVPGQQAYSVRGNINKNKVSIEEATAWKNGMLQFKGADIKTIMRQVERWYDVETIYKDDIKEFFIANIPRSVPLSEFLKLLELTGEVHFEIKGKTITVMK